MLLILALALCVFFFTILFFPHVLHTIRYHIATSLTTLPADTRDALQDHNLLRDEVILLTGATGGLGAELVQQILPLHPRGLVLVDIDLPSQFPPTLLTSLTALARTNPTWQYELFVYNVEAQRDNAGGSPTRFVVEQKHTIPPTNNTDFNNINIVTIIFITTDITLLTTWDDVNAIAAPHFATQHDDNNKPHHPTTPITILINNAGLVHPVNLPHAIIDTTNPQAAGASTTTSTTITSPPQLFVYDVNTTLQQQQRIYDVNTHAPIRLVQEMVRDHAVANVTAHCAMDRTCNQNKDNTDNKNNNNNTLTTSPKQLQIITITSAASMSYSAQLSAYCGSKAATTQMLRAFRFEHQRLLYDQQPLQHQHFLQQPLLDISNQQIDSTLQIASKETGAQEETPATTTAVGTARVQPQQQLHFLKSFCSLFTAIFHQLLPGYAPPAVVSTAARTIKSVPHIHWSIIMPWHITTKMFHNIHSLPIIQLFVPSLTPRAVCSAIVSQILTKKRHTIVFGQHSSYHEQVLPALLTLTPLLNMLPVWLSDLAVGLAGGYNAMDSIAILTNQDFVEQQQKQEQQQQNTTLTSQKQKTM